MQLLWESPNCASDKSTSTDGKKNTFKLDFLSMFSQIMNSFDQTLIKHTPSVGTGPGS